MSDQPPYDRFTLPRDIPDPDLIADDSAARGYVLRSPAGRGWLPAGDDNGVSRDTGVSADMPVVGDAGSCASGGRGGGACLAVPGDLAERLERLLGEYGLALSGPLRAIDDGGGDPLGALSDDPGSAATAWGEGALAGSGASGTRPGPAPLFDARRQALFCEALADSANVRLAARAAGVSRQTAYRARRAHPDLARVWDTAIALSRHVAAEALADRALNGVEEPVYYHGEEIARRVRFDSRLLLAHLARLDAQVAAMAGDGGGAGAGVQALSEGQFDEALSCLAQGRALPAPVAPPALCPPDAVLPGDAGDEGDDEGNDEGRGDGSPMCPEAAALARYYARVDAMDLHRPDDAPALTSLGEYDAVQYAQLLAFEAGEEKWWLRGPPHADEGLADVGLADAGDGVDDTVDGVPGVTGWRARGAVAA